jgi:hypothetical protein
MWGDCWYRLKGGVRGRRGQTPGLDEKHNGARRSVG